MKQNKSEHKKFYKRKIGKTWGSMSKDKVGLYKNSRVLLYEGRKRNYVRFLLTKKTIKIPSEGKNYAKKSSEDITFELKPRWLIPQYSRNKTRHVIVPQVYMECITEPEILPRLPCIM